MGKSFLNINKYSTKSKLIYSFVILYTLCSISFLNPIFYDFTNLSKYLYSFMNLCILPFVFSFFTFINNKKYLLISGIKLLLSSFVISLFSAYIFWNQSFIDTIFASLFPIFGYNLYFFLIKNQLPVSKIEQLIKVFGIISIFAFIFNFISYPFEIFKNSFFIQDLSRGFHRIQLRGFGFIYIFYFMSLVKALNNKGMNWLFWAIVSFICIILSLTRTYMFFTIILSVLYILRKSNLLIKFGIVLFLSLSIQLFLDSQIYKNLSKVTSKDVNSAESYIRIRAATYFIGEFQPSIFTKVLGNGFPYGTKTKYGRFVENLKTADWFYIDDLGLLGLYIYLGLFGIIAYLIIFSKCLTARIPPEYAYIKYFIYFLILISFNSYATYNSDFLIAIVFVFYLFEIVHSKVSTTKMNKVVIKNNVSMLGMD